MSATATLSNDQIRRSMHRTGSDWMDAGWRAFDSFEDAVAFAALHAGQTVEISLTTLAGMVADDPDRFTSIRLRLRALQQQGRLSLPATVTAAASRRAQNHDGPITVGLELDPVTVTCPQLSEQPLVLDYASLRHRPLDQALQIISDPV